MAVNQRIVREIPAMPQAMSMTERKKLVEVAYCRVSTEDVSQEDSYERQISYYTDKICANHEVEFGGIYADQGISGTHVETRPEFQRMIADARAGKINVIRCKSIQRFGRNTVDVLSAVRELREMGVAVMFEQQGINTLDTSGEVLITVMAACSEQESRTISHNVRFGFKEKFRKGEVMVNWARFLGYRRNNETKELEIVEEEAVIIRRIFREFIAGLSTSNIANGLMQDGIKTAEWKKPTSEKQKTKLRKKEEEWLKLSLEERKKKPLAKWYPATIANMIANEKYCGDSIQGKTYKVDVLSKKRVENTGQSYKFYNSNTHPAIIDKETFDMAQEEMKRRNGMRGSTNTGKAKYSSKYALSKMLECGADGEHYRRYAYYPKEGGSIPVWICRLKKVKKDDPRKCKQAWVKETDIYKLYMEIISEIGANSDFIEQLTKNVCESTESNDVEKISELQAKMDTISKDIIEVMQANIDMNSKQDKIKELMAKQDAYAEESKLLTERTASIGLSKERVIKLKETIESMNICNEIDYEMMRANIEKIVILNGEAKYIFRCGLEYTKQIKQGL